jgi:catechol 2,3-dioxygenase-like lactoylglutathione lyase family enzyme
MKTTTLFLAGFLATVAACSLGTPSRSDAPPAVAAGFDPLDTMSPASSKADALALPLQVVTLSTRDISAIERFYVDGLGMTLTGPVEVEADVQARQAELWDMPEGLGWQEYHLTRPGADIHGRPAMAIRVLVVDQDVPSVHESWDSRSYGGFSMGFPNKDQIGLDAKIRGLGFGARGSSAEIYDVPRTDGSMYSIHETIFDAPDHVHAVGIDRVGMLPLGAVDSDTGLGGPGYSAQVIDDSDTVLAFYTGVLGLEVRRDSIFKSAGSDGAMALPDGTEFRFTILMSPGHGPGGHMLFVDFTNIEGIDSGVAPRVPHLGIGMWSYPVTSLDEVLRRAREAGTPVVHAPVEIADPLHGNVRTATLLAPNEFLIEVFESVAP